MNQSAREYHRRYSKEWAARNPEKTKAIKLRYYNKNKERLNAESRAYRADHREQMAVATRAWEKANPELVSMQRVRRRIKAMNAKINGDLKYHYDITLEAYNEALKAQGGVCYICKKLEVTSRTNRLVVDHDHSTGKIRGLLCHRCNCGLGYFKDDPVLIEKALDYLRRGQFLDED